MSESNPYEPPRAASTQSLSAGASSDAEARSVEAGRGWEWIAAGFALFMKQPGMWVLLFVVFAVCYIVVGVVPLLGGIANMLIYPVFVAGFMIAAQTLENGRELALPQLFTGFKQNTGDLVVVGLLCLVATIVILIPVAILIGGAGFFASMRGGAGHGLAAVGIMAVVGGLVALALMIPVVMAAWFAPALVVLQNLKPVAAMKMSFFACLKNIVPFLFYGVIMLLLAIVAAIPFGLGFLVLGPVAMVSMYVAYRDIFSES